MMVIVSGPVGIGKTSHIKQWASHRDDVTGLLSPIDPIEGRFFVDLATGERMYMEMKQPGGDVLRIGRYTFSKRAFDWAQSHLIQASKRRHRWLVIDEIGPLELSGHGLDAAVRHVLHHRRRTAKTVLVVRENLVDAVLERYALQSIDVIVTWPVAQRRIP